jgi:hypothetical protein
LTQHQRTKAEAFLPLIEYDKATKEFYCGILEGYNTRRRLLKRDKEFGFSCPCQGFQTKLKKYRESGNTSEEPFCSHIGALKLFFVERNKAHHFGPFKEGNNED